MGHAISSFLKRFLDVVVSGTALILATPLLVLAAVAILLDDPGPIFFSQERAGRFGRAFKVLKLRSMRVHGLPNQQVGQVTSHHPLVTRVGRVIRRFKIDELPQLVNVLLGHMSLVGPRPAIPEQAANYTAFERLRLSVQPGLTGWAQVNGNTSLSWSQRIALDIWYVHHWSLWLDLRILCRTVLVVLGGEHPNDKYLTEAQQYADCVGRGGR